VEQNVLTAVLQTTSTYIKIITCSEVHPEVDGWLLDWLFNYLFININHTVYENTVNTSFYYENLYGLMTHVSAQLGHHQVSF